jgi:CMP-N,N'-diacetyllegionaminic acid synthase
MNILGLITARGGSKSIPRKNIIDIHGKPLLAYSCEAALGSKFINRLVLSTDDDEIAEVGKQYGAEVPFMRPEHLAQDNTPSLPVVQHAVKWLADHDNWDTDIMVLLQPTSPLRRSEHINEALQTMLDAHADTVVSVVEVPHNFSPYKLMKLEDGKLSSFWDTGGDVKVVRRQETATLYARNGPAILACNPGTLFDKGSFYGDTIVPYVMSPLDSVDIDEPSDIPYIEFILSNTN